jgi:hypothetical protein
VLPSPTLLDETVEPISHGGEETIHRRTEEIIIKKLASFDIEAKVLGRNAGPVVTQYEVQPAPHVKVSRIEALADDLAMALAARTLRIEAPIPGKAAVGIEIPNQDFNVVTLRGILESVDFGATGSKLTFALGRDVAGRVRHRREHRIERRVQRRALRGRGRRRDGQHRRDGSGAEDEAHQGTTGSSVGNSFAFTSAEPSANALLKRVSAVPGLPHLNARKA